MHEAAKYFKAHRTEALVFLVCALLGIGYLCCLPRDIFRGTSYSTVVLDRNGELLGARIADDGQWRFPPTDSLPDRYVKALIRFEDRAFRYHGGVNPAALARATWQNLRSHRVVSGGSTITMQVIRMSRRRERTLGQKCIEALLATRLEQRCTKDEILCLYASHAPFGGNVVGIDAAAWRYYGHSAQDLSWGEAALLAVLPNSPSSINVSRRRQALTAKRNRLLKELYEHGDMDEWDYELAVSEPLPDEPYPLPQYAPHLTEQYVKTAAGTNVRTSIDAGLQRRVNAVTDRWQESLALTGINDLAAVVFDVHTGEVVAYVGNANSTSDGTPKRPGAQVDIVRAPRSTGSILKPFLYCALLQDGLMLPNTLLPDVPVNINGFSPQNFDQQYCGAVSASEALAHSLNIPSVHMLRMYGVPAFKDLLVKAGMTTLTRDASVYGLSLILGGAEGSLFDITRIYASLSAFYQGEKPYSPRPRSFPFNDKVAVWYTLEALSGVHRTDEMDWRLISSVRKVAWKTGTSWGFRDAWAVGVTPDYAVGVWAGNAQGQGSPGLVGARTAGPVLFDIFNLLPPSDWFEEPLLSEGIEAEVCPESGCLAGQHCFETDTLLLPRKALRSSPCPYHKPDGAFVLPPAMAYYYASLHPEYKTHRSTSTSDAPMEFIYPQQGSVISVPRLLDGREGGVVFNLAHSDPDAEVFWHLDDHYLGSTLYIHQKTLSPDPGPHTVTVVDTWGRSLSIGFTID